jgi:hypothetical protein
MPSVIQKAKQKEAKPPVKIEPIPTPTQSLSITEPGKLSIEQLVDAWGTLSDRIDAINAAPEFAQFKLVTDELKKRLAEFPAENPIELVGDHWMIEASACSKQPRRIEDLEKVVQFIGLTAFLKLVSMSVSDAEKYLNPEQFGQVVSDNTDKYTENRKLTKKFIG